MRTRHRAGAREPPALGAAWVTHGVHARRVRFVLRLAGRLVDLLALRLDAGQREHLRLELLGRGLRVQVEVWVLVLAMFDGHCAAE
jgi:hypothetical protein